MNTSHGITSTYSPNPAFFRRNRSSQNPGKSTTLFDDPSDDNSSSSDEDDSSSSSSSSQSSSSSFAGRNRHDPCFVASPSSTSINSQNHSTSPLPSAVVSPPLKRLHLKLSLALIKIRQALANRQWDSLLTALRSLSTTALPSDLATLGLYIPILDRLGNDLIRVLSDGEGDIDLGKVYRRSLNKEDAKALISLIQRWSGSGNGSTKGKGKESEEDWYSTVRVIVAKHKTPSFMSRRPHGSQTSALLSGLEALLLPTSLPKLSLTELELTLDSMEKWEVLRRSEEVLGWYLSFDEHHTKDSGQAGSILRGIKSLDLSKNRLNGIPTFLPLLFPSLETLSLTHNQFQHLPPVITLFPHLRRLKTHGNQLAKSYGGTSTNTSTISRIVTARWRSREEGDRESRSGGSRVETLVNVAAMVTRKHTSQPKKRATSPFSRQNNGVVNSNEGDRSDSSTNTDDDEEDSIQLYSKIQLPQHLQLLISKSYTCASCQRFISSLNSYSHLPPLFEKVHHLDPGVRIPTYRVPPPPLPLYTFSPNDVNYDVFLPTLPSMTAALSPESPSNFVPPQLLSAEEKVFIALLARGAGLATYVIGEGDTNGVGGGSRGYSFCVDCAGNHLGLTPPSISSVLHRAIVICECYVCKEERKVRSNGYGGDPVMRWLRRRPGPGSGSRA